MMGYVCSNARSVLGTRPVLVASTSLYNVPMFIWKQSYADMLIMLYHWYLPDKLKFILLIMIIQKHFPEYPLRRIAILFLLNF